MGHLLEKYSQLFLLRHGREADDELTSWGNEKLKETAETIDRLINKNHFPTLMASKYRRTIDSALIIGDIVKIKGKPVNLGQPTICKYLGDDLNFTQFMESATDVARGGELIVVAHLPFVKEFPAHFLNRYFGQPNIPKDFGDSYGCGIYIDLKTGEWKRLPLS
jgi:phosphohistidine phosphatase SixA